MEEYKKLTRDEAKVLPIGTKVNFGNGCISEILFISEEKPYGKKWTPEGLIDWTEYDVVLSENGKTKSVLLSALTGATIESLDPTVERCEYCGQLRAFSDMKTEEIRVNYAWRRGRYCADKPCASYAQFSAEG